MTVWNAIILGLVQGATEFLPVSGSGHLSILSNLFNMTTPRDGHMLFNVLLRLGALISVCIVYWKDIVQMFSEVLGLANLGPLAGQHSRHYPGARLFLMLFVGSLPLLLILPVNDLLDRLYYHSVYIGIAIVLTGCALYVSDKMAPGKKAGGSMTISDALIVGICQCIAVIPGLSRVGITAAAGIAIGLRRDFALKYAFLLSLPAMFGACIMSIAAAARSAVDWSCVPAYLVGMAVSIVSGVAAISLMKYIVNKGKFGGFAYYCWVVGVLSVILSLIF